jgi:hypothetical protein
VRSLLRLVRHDLRAGFAAPAFYAATLLLALYCFVSAAYKMEVNLARRYAILDSGGVTADASALLVEDGGAVELVPTAEVGRESVLLDRSTAFIQVTPDGSLLATAAGGPTLHPVKAGIERWTVEIENEVSGRVLRSKGKEDLDLPLHRVPIGPDDHRPLVIVALLCRIVWLTVATWSFAMVVIARSSYAKLVRTHGAGTVLAARVASGVVFGAWFLLLDLGAVALARAPLPLLPAQLATLALAAASGVLVGNLVASVGVAWSTGEPRPGEIVFGFVLLLIACGAATPTGGEWAPYQCLAPGDQLVARWNPCFLLVHLAGRAAGSVGLPLHPAEALARLLLFDAIVAAIALGITRKVR